MATEDELRAAVQTVAEGAGQISTAESAIEAAHDRQEEAEELAEEIAAAALESERGQILNALQTEVSSWPAKLEQALASLRMEFQTMVEAVKATVQPAPAAASPAVEAATVAATVTAASSGQPSTATVAETTAVTVEPAAASPGAAEAAQQDQPIAKRKPKFL